jgi:predicted nucleic acid-binding protein
MTYSSSLADDASPLIIDTSVLINLHASRHGARILAAMPNNVLVPEIVAAELDHETSRVNGEHQFIQELIAWGKARLVTLSETEYEVYTDLVSGSSSIDDGEAATITIAFHRGYLPVIDERKGRSKAQVLMPAREPAWSLDLFRHPFVRVALGETESAHALYLALRDGRMRIHENHCDSVIREIGVRRALDCSSLPNYKTRRSSWQELVSQMEACNVRSSS